MKSTEFITEISRRDILKGIGAGMIAAGSGSALYDKLTTPDTEPEVKPQTKIKPLTNSELERKLLLVALNEFEWDPVELAQFMAQCAHETMGFQTLEEIGDDRKFRRKYGSPAWKGRGYIQLTGKKNYEDFEWNFPNIKLTQKPQDAAEPMMAAFIASWWWKNKVAPRLNDFTDTARATRIINGPAMLGLDERQDYFKKYLQAWNVL